MSGWRSSGRKRNWDTQSIKEVKGKKSVRTEAVAIASNTAEKPKDQIKERLQGHWCYSLCGQYRVEGWKPGDKRLRSEQVIAKLKFMVDFPLDKRKNRMETGVESKSKCFCCFWFFLKQRHKFLCSLIKWKKKRREKNWWYLDIVEGQEFEAVKAWRR